LPEASCAYHQNADVIQSAKENERKRLGADPAGIEHALALVEEFARGKEKSWEDIRKRIDLILQYLLEIEPFEQQRITISGKRWSGILSITKRFQRFGPDQNRLSRK